MNMPAKLDARTLARDRNIIAAVCSIVPGLGHIYKGYYAPGFVLMLLVTPLVLWAGLLLALATAGIGLLVTALFWGMVAFDAFCEEDHRKHHFFDLL